MAILTLKVEGSTVGIVGRVITLNEEQSTSFVVWALHADPKITETINGEEVERDRTPSEAVQAAIDGIVQGTVNNVNSYKILAAKLAAEEAAKVGLIEL